MALVRKWKRHNFLFRDKLNSNFLTIFHMEPNTEYLNYKVGNGSYHLHRENAEYIFIQLFLLMILNKKP